MLSPRYLDGAADTLVEIYSQLETDILRDMARRIAKLGKVTDATDYQARILAEAGGLRQNIAKILKGYDKRIIKAVQETYTEALKKKHGERQPNIQDGDGSNGKRSERATNTRDRAKRV